MAEEITGMYNTMEGDIADINMDFCHWMVVSGASPVSRMFTKSLICNVNTLFSSRNRLSVIYNS